MTVDQWKISIRFMWAVLSTLIRISAKIPPLPEVSELEVQLREQVRLDKHV